MDREIALLSLAFAGLLVAKVIIENPMELMGWKGILLVVTVLITSTLILAKRRVINLLRDIRWMIGRKTFPPLSFYGIKDIEIKDDWIEAKLSGGVVGYAILRVEQAVLPYLYREDEVEEQFYKPYVRVVQGLGFKTFLVIKSSRFDVTDFQLKLYGEMAKANPERKRRLQKVMDKVGLLSKHGKEKRIFIVIPSTAKNRRTDLQSKVSQVKSLLNKHLGLNAELFTASDILCEFQKYVDPDLNYSLVKAEQFSNLSLTASNLLHIEKIKMFSNGILLENGSETTVNLFFRIKEQFSDPAFDWLPKLMDTSQDLSYDLITEIAPLSLSETLADLDGEIRKMKISIKALQLQDKVPKQSMIERVRELETFQRKLREGKEKPMRIDMYGRVFGTMRTPVEGRDG